MTVPPSLLEFTSKSSNKPLNCPSARVPCPEFSMCENILSSVSFKLLSFSQFSTTLQKRAL